MNASLAETPLHAWHAAHGGRLVDFAGWSMPVQYTSIVAEHQATRTAVGLFDVSHMGRLEFTGPDAGPFLESLLTRRVSDMPQGKIRYALVTNQQGGILDDVLVYHLAEPYLPEFESSGTGAHFQLVVNASNRGKILDWLRQYQPACDVTISDRTRATAMIAIQGPHAVELVAARLSGVDLSAMRYYTAAKATICGQSTLVSRTGYTGEDGCELILSAAAGEQVWQALLDAGQSLGAQPAGLGCRDTLRLEAAMPLYGHELSEQIDPFQAGLEFAVQLDGRAFPGSSALAELKAQPRRAVRIGLELAGKRVPREGYAVLSSDGGQVVGNVTSGTFSPTLARPIAMAYVSPDQAAIGSTLAVDVRGSAERATVVSLPFYQRSS